MLIDGRVKIENNAAERGMRAIASLIETCEMNGMDTQAWLTATLTAIVQGHKQSKINDRLPWDYAAKV